MLRVITIALLALAVSVPGAHAQNAPPGNSGIDEYVEAVPSTTGPKPTNKSNGDQGKVLRSGQQKALEQQGADGKAAAELAQRFGTPGTGKTHTKRANRSQAAGNHGDDATVDADGVSGDSVASSLRNAVLPDAGSGGLGPALPIILVAIAAAGVAAAILRRHRAS
jgi:hypothetical protein